MGYTAMIKDRLLGDINPQQEAALDKVIRRGNDQLAMIGNILQATAAESEKIKLDIHEVNLGDFLADLRSAYDVPIYKDLAFNWNYPSDLPVIKTDDGKLKQILQNLIDNAAKFTEKGTIIISARIELATGNQLRNSNFEIRNQSLPPRSTEAHDRSHAFVEFKVADTGVGIPPDALPLIFDKFRQADSSETRLFGGVGMGLYIVRKFAELLGGTVEVESEAGKGSTFTVTLPCGQ